MSGFAALIIGNSKYKNNDIFPDVQYCKNDASELYDELCFGENSIFDKEKSSLILNSTKQNLLNELDLFFDRLEENDLVLFFFAGHGKVSGEKSYFLIMNDTMHNSNSVVSTAFNIESLIPYIDEKRISRYIVILDSCYAGKALNTPGILTRNSSNQVSEQYIENIFSGRGKIFIASTNYYQLASESPDLQHGFYSNYLIKVIKEGIKEKKENKYISIFDIHDFVIDRLKQNHPELNQTPIISGKDRYNKIYLCINKQYTLENTKQIIDEKLTFQKNTKPIPDSKNNISRDENSERKHYLGKKHINRFVNFIFFYDFNIIKIIDLITKIGFYSITICLIILFFKYSRNILYAIIGLSLLTLTTFIISLSYKLIIGINIDSSFLYIQKLLVEIEKQLSREFSSYRAEIHRLQGLIHNLKKDISNHQSQVNLADQKGNHRYSIKYRNLGVIKNNSIEELSKLIQPLQKRTVLMSKGFQMIELFNLYVESKVVELKPMKISKWASRNEELEISLEQVLHQSKEFYKAAKSFMIENMFFSKRQNSFSDSISKSQILLDKMNEILICTGVQIENK